MSVLSKKENTKASKFIEKHSACYSVIVIKLEKENGIGRGVTIKCKKCKTKKNITDYDSW